MKNTIDLVFTLKRVPLFATIPEHILAEIASLIEIVTVEEGHRLITMGDVAEGLYVIKSGRVSVHTDRADICELAENNIVGELGVLSPVLRSAHVTTLTPCILYSIHRQYFLQLMNEIPEITPPILHVLTDKIIKANQAYMDIIDQQ